MDMSKAIEIFIGALVAVLVGVSLLPSIFSSVSVVTTNATDKAQFGSTMSLVTLLPLLFVIVILIVVVGFIVWKRE